MGVPGYGTDQEYLYLKTEGLRYHPDLVILCAFFNDFEESFSIVNAWNGRPKGYFLSMLISSFFIHRPSLAFLRVVAGYLPFRAHRRRAEENFWSLSEVIPSAKQLAGSRNETSHIQTAIRGCCRSVPPAGCAALNSCVFALSWAERPDDYSASDGRFGLNGWAKNARSDGYIADRKLRQDRHTSGAMSISTSMGTKLWPRLYMRTWSPMVC